MKAVGIAFCALLIAAGCAPAGAATLFTATIDGAQAGTGAAGTGFAKVILNDLMTAVDVDVSFSGLSGPAIAAHIHCCAAPGTAAGVVVPFPGFPSTTSGTYVASNLPIDAASVTGLFQGLAYVNIHTALFRAGEIRGQLQEVPEPGTVSLLLLGGIALATARIRGARTRH